jgi:hypothetical protein
LGLGFGFLRKGFEKLIAAKLVWVLGEKESWNERRLMGAMGFGGLLNQWSKGLKFIDALSVRERERERERES